MVYDTVSVPINNTTLGFEFEFENIKHFAKIDLFNTNYPMCHQGKKSENFNLGHATSLLPFCGVLPHFLVSKEFTFKNWIYNRELAQKD